MESILKELIDVFENQSCLQRSLLCALIQEKHAIVGSDLSALHEANSEKESLIRKINKLEDERVRILADLEEPSGEKCQDLTLERLVQISEEPYASRLDGFRNDLISSIKTIRELNEGNKVLLTHSINLVTGSLRLLNNLTNCNAVYYRSGKIQNKDHGARVLSGEV